MARETLERRMSALEKTVQEQVTVRDLQAFQSVLSAQILQLGVEMGVGFSALRDEIRTGDEETRGLIEQRTAEILSFVAAGDQENRRHAQMLHEDVIARISAIRKG